ncbi:hypothetical protein DM77_2504 [Burkholderia mallei]|nr:hypothetical protein DM77_2504 [Burkholderia mallei]
MRAAAARAQINPRADAMTTACARLFAPILRAAFDR